MPSLLRRWHWVHKDLVVQCIHTPNLGSPNWHFFSLHSHVPKYPKNSNYVLSRGARPLRGAAEWKIWIHHLWPPVEPAMSQLGSYARSQPFHFCESLQAHAQGGQEVGCHCYDACPTGANLIVALCWSGKLGMIMFIHVYTVDTVTCTSPCRCSWPCQETMYLETCDHSSLELH